MAKKALFLTIVLCLVVALMTVTAFAADTVEPATGACGEGLTWTVDAQGKLTISGTGAMETYDYGSAPWYGFRDAITSVVVEGTVTGISDGAFHGFSAVVDMTLPFVGGSVRTMEQADQFPLGYIFGTESYDGGMETQQWFYWDHLEELVSNTYYVPDSLRSVKITGGNILAGAFYNCSGLTSIDLPDGIDRIGVSAFTHCESLTSVEIPEGVDRIWSYAFSDCDALESVSIPDSVTGIGSSAFVRCVSLREVVLPPNVAGLGSYAFSGCSALEKVVFCGDVPKGMVGMFQDLTLTAYYPSENGTWTEDVRTGYGGTVTWVPYVFDTGIIVSGTCGETALWRMNEEGLLTISGEGEVSYEGDAPWYGYAADVIEIVVSPYITKLPEGTFSGCGSLEAITLPFVGNEVSMSIGSFGHIFGQKNYAGAQAVVQSRTYYIPAALRRVKVTERAPSARAFYNCAMLETVILPASNIKEYMFANCAGLTSIVAGNFETIGEGAFSGCIKLQEISLPQSLTSIGKSAFYQCRSLTSIVIPERVTKIGSAAFAGCSGLEHITIPFVGLDPRSGIEYPFGVIFGTEAYEGGVATEQYILDVWEFTEVYSTYFIPEKLTSVSVTGGAIPRSAFENCNGLTDVTLPASVGIIYGDAFSGCGSLTQIVIPEKVSLIGSAAFKGCSSLTEITFMGDAPKIDEDAFTGVVAVASYPADRSSWDADVKRNYGGTIVWVLHGETVTVPILRLQYPTLSFEDEVRYNVYYSAEQLEGVVEMGLITFEGRAVDGTIADAVEVIPGYVTDGSVYMVQSEGVAAPLMGDTVYFKVYAKLADGTYAYSPMGGYSAVAYAKQMLADADATPRMQSLVAALMGYGAEAQKFFGHDTANLMDGFLTGEQKALVEDYDEAMMDPPATVETSKVGIFVPDTFAFGQCYPTVSFDSAFALNYYFTAKLPCDDGMTLYYWDADTYASVSKLTMDNATGSVPMEDLGDGQYWGQVAGIAAKELDHTVCAVGVYTSGNVTYTTGIISYSLGRYCEGIAANDASSQQALAKATAVYGYYAKAYFAG